MEFDMFRIYVHILEIDFHAIQIHFLLRCIQFILSEVYQLIEEIYLYGLQMHKSFSSLRFKFTDKIIDTLGIINVVKSISLFELFWVFLFLVNNRSITQKLVNLKQIYCCKNNGRKRYDLESLQNNFLIFAFIW